jgi:ATP-binding cassette subfamily C (CFTR/MRP) protein 1
MGVPAYEEVLTIAQNWLVRSASEVEQNIVSVERMLQYIELKPEAPYEVPEAQPESGWPSEGRLEFRCVFSVPGMAPCLQPPPGNTR